jgi:hypothetical protein
MKTLLFAVVGLVVGIVLGAGGMHQTLTPQLLELDAKLKVQERVAAALQRDPGDAEKLARLEAEREQNATALSKLRGELEVLEKASTVDNAVPEPAAIETIADAVPAPQPTEGDRENRGRRGGPWDRGGTPEEREARRQEFVTQLRDNLTEFFTGELEKSNTPEVQERLVALETQVHDMMDIRRQMREVDSEDERDALRTSFEESMDAARGIMREQQQHMIGAIAGQFNINDEADRAAFELAVQSAVESPFFRDNPASLLWSAGRPSGSGRGYGRPSRSGNRP